MKEKSFLNEEMYTSVDERMRGKRGQCIKGSSPSTLLKKEMISDGSWKKRNGRLGLRKVG